MAKTALVTGASSGIGEAIALHLIKAGYTVYGTSRREREDNHGIRFVAMDVDNDDSVQQAVGQVLGEIRQIDVLVNAAGLGIVGAVEEVSIEHAKQVFETNVFGLMRVTQAVLPSMRMHKSGLVINISSIAGLVGLPFRGIYAASKHAVEGLTESLALELHPFGVRVTLVQPGGFKTNIAEGRPVTTELEGRPYGPYLDYVNELVAHEIEQAPGPEPVGKLVTRIVKKKNPTLRFPIGNFLEKLTPTLKKWLPWGLYAAMIRRFHKL